MSGPDEEAQEFRRALLKFPVLWDGIDIRVMAFRVEGVWHNALTRCRLVASAGQVPKPRYLPASENVRTFHVILPASDLPSLLGSIVARELSIDGTSIRYDRHEMHDGSVRQYNFHWYEGMEVRESQYSRDWVPTTIQPWRGLMLSGSGNTFDEILRPLSRSERDLDDEVHALHAPLDGINGIAEHVIGMKAEWRHERRTQFTLTAPFEVRLDPAGCRLHHGWLDVSVKAGSLVARSHVDIGYVASDDGNVLVANTREVAPAEWDSPLPDIANLRIEATGATSATVLLRLGRRRVERMSLTDYSRLGANPRQAAYELVDPDLAFLRAGLGIEPTKDAKDFERAFARLLTLLGFQAIALGPEGKLTDEFDVVAFDPFGSLVLAVECTTSSLNSGGKLGKLIVRASELAEELPDHKVQAVIVTTKPNVRLSDAERQHAARDRIAVLAAEELDELLNRVGVAAPISEIAGYITSRIPELPPRGPFPGVMGGLGR